MWHFMETDIYFNKLPYTSHIHFIHFSLVVEKGSNAGVNTLWKIEPVTFCNKLSSLLLRSHLWPVEIIWMCYFLFQLWTVYWSRVAVYPICFIQSDSCVFTCYRPAPLYTANVLICWGFILCVWYYIKHIHILQCLWILRSICIWQ